MFSKKILFSLIVILVCVQAIQTSDYSMIFNFIGYGMHDDIENLRNFLIEHPEAIHAKNANNESVFMNALKNSNDPHTVPILLNAGANPNEPNRRFETPLHYLANAYNSGHKTRAEKELLIKKAVSLVLHGADDTIEDSNGQIPMEVSPKLITHVANLIYKYLEERDQDVAIGALSFANGQNIGFAMTLKQLLGN